MSASDAQRNRQIIANLGVQIDDVFNGVVADALASIKYGSPVTGAPGQPVVEGTLLASWELERPSADVAIIGSDSPYANPIEHGTGKFGPLTLHATTGGFHSVKLTRAGMRRILADRVQRAQSAGDV